VRIIGAYWEINCIILGLCDFLLLKTLFFTAEVRSCSVFCLRLSGKSFVFIQPDYRPTHWLTAFRAASLAGLAINPVLLIATLYFAPAVIGKNTALP
jgi:hypothetical protein